jgi:KUP system potassium uptake protein
MSSAAASSTDLSQHGDHAPAIRSSRDLARISLGALGVVYGDIGTSPLYAMKECFALPKGDGSFKEGMTVDVANVLGITSLFFWALTLVIVVKYLGFVMRADNRGEGGILALLALLKPKPGEKGGRVVAVYVLLGLFGAALLYGDGVITPVVSVLGAIEGLGVGNNVFTTGRIVVISIAILVGLFVVQKRGTHKVGAVFGPVMLVWFAMVAVLGGIWIARRPEILYAVNPIHAVHFFAKHGKEGFLILGAVVLCITGGEALYADMGHFGKRPIRAAWYAIVFPALILCYFGQGALLIDQGPVENPFYAMGLQLSEYLRYPMIIVATFAAIIASQALISGAFSLTQSAVQLGYWPRVTIKHTSGHAEGQIYVPEVNGALMVGCIALTLQFKESSSLAAAYGIAVTGTMSITSVLYYGVLRRWGWGGLAAGALVAFFLCIDLPFFLANIHKIAEGGWFPLAVGVGIFTLMTTWRRGRALLAEAFLAQTLPLDVFMADLQTTKPHRVSGTAVFMTSNPKGAPPVLLHHWKHNKVLHEQILLLSISTEHVPEVPREERIQEIVELGLGFYQVRARYGFMQTPNVIELLDLCAEKGLVTSKADTSYFLGRETLLITERKGMARWRKMLFSFMSRNARPANAFFRIPPNRVVELGTQIEL